MEILIAARFVVAIILGVSLGLLIFKAFPELFFIVFCVTVSVACIAGIGLGFAFVFDALPVAMPTTKLWLAAAFVGAFDLSGYIWYYINDNILMD